MSTQDMLDTTSEPGPADDEPVTAPDAPAPGRRTRRWARAWPYLVVIVVALAGSSLHVARYTVLSPFDESRHVDYMARLFEDGHVVKLGDKLGDTAMRLEACRDVDVAGYTPPPCDTNKFDPVDFRDKGYNNAVNNPPLYYLITGTVAEAAKVTGLSDNILDPARVLGGVWLALGLALAVYAGRLLGARDVPLVAAAVIFALAPEPLFMASTVNADSASVFGGALVLVTVLLWERGRLRVGWVLGAGALVASLKMTNLVGVGIVGAWLLTQAYRAHRFADEPIDTKTDAETDAEIGRRTPREYLWACGLLVAGAVAVTGLWLAIASARATVDSLALPSNGVFYDPRFPWKTFVLRQNVFSLFPPLGSLRPPVLVTLMNDVTAYAAVWLAGGVLIASVLRFNARERVVALGGWSGILLIVAGPGFILSTWLVNQVIFQPATRYGLSAIAMLVVATAAMVKGRVGTVLISMFALLMAGTVLGTLVFA